MIAGFTIFGLFVIGWFIIIAVFLIADYRKADQERKQKKPINLYVILTMIILIPSLPIYLLADNECPLSCVPYFRCTADNDSGCDAVDYVRFGMLLDTGCFADTTHCFYSLLPTLFDVYSKEVQGYKAKQRCEMLTDKTNSIAML